MSSLLKTLLAPSLALALATPALAQEGASVALSETSDGGSTPPPDPMAGGSGKYPVKYAARPLTLTKMTAVPQLDIKISRLSLGILGGSTTFGFQIGGQFGITEDLQVNALLIPLNLSPSAGFGDMRLGGRFRFIKGNFQLGADLQLNIPTNTSFGIIPSLVGQLNSGNFRLDVGAGVALVFTDPLGKELQVPVAASLNFGDAFYAQVITGIYLPNFDFLRLPLGFGAGYTIAKGGQPMLDLGATFTFDNYLLAGAGGDALNFDSFTALITGKFYLFL